MNSYWAQWSHAELMSMQGIEVDDFQDDDLLDSTEEEKEEQKEGCCSGCMECIGISWRDFM